MQACWLGSIHRCSSLEKVLTSAFNTCLLASGAAGVHPNVPATGHRRGAQGAGSPGSSHRPAGSSRRGPPGRRRCCRVAGPGAKRFGAGPSRGHQARSLTAANAAAAAAAAAAASAQCWLTAPTTHLLAPTTELVTHHLGVGRCVVRMPVRGQRCRTMCDREQSRSRTASPASSKHK